MPRLHRAWMLCALAAVLVGGGCGQRSYRAETVLEADGRVSRAIYQPADDTPAEARNPRLWTAVTYAEEIQPDRWTGSIRDLPKAPMDKDHSYFAAWGQFASPKKLPPTYIKSAPRGLPDGKLVVDYRREDYGLVVGYRWKETLTDIVTLDDMHRGRRQFLDVVIPLVHKCLEVGLGPEYDVDRLTEWFNTTGSDLFVEITDAFFEAGTRGQLPPGDGWKQTMADVCARYGMNLRDGQGQLLDEDRARRVVALFAGDVIRQRLKRRDGQPVPQTAVDDLLEWVNLKDYSQSKNPRLARLDGLAQKVVAKQFGSQQKFEELMAPLGARMLGLYRVEILGPPRRFDYTLRMPGPIVETNGLLLADNRVRWKFEAVQAYPYGYAMECRALVPQLALQRELPGAAPFKSRQDMLAFVAAVEGDFRLGETLRQCVKQKSTEPLYDTRDKVAAESGDTRPYDTVIRLLKLPAKPAMSSP